MATSTAMVSSRVILLLAVILLSMTSVQVRSDDSPPPPPAPPLSAGGQCANDCTNDYLFQLERCFPLFTGIPRARNYNTEECCQHIRGKPSAAGCLCAAFRRNRSSDAFRRVSDFGNNIDYVFIVCDEDELPGLACPASLTG
jgi:hypothetical protein